ncbi:hypothetical protein HHK36_033203 [Tetracentron sinense]|uniref:Thiol methyltransferase 2 n=1 Tax=Tetracentron sinense TaxID=13715 RepID=A0A834Y919_TETSI|nr:hypothetical protein HHK36_033203 [Tetracentron sinense]
MVLIPYNSIASICRLPSFAAAAAAGPFVWRSNPILICSRTQLRMRSREGKESFEKTLNSAPKVDKIQELLNKDSTGGWEECWEQELTPWDLGQPTPMILHLHQTGVLPKGRALVPGCGSGHDVVAIACPERYVVGLDISDNAIKKARELSSSLPNANYLTFIKADFFTLHPAELFDLIFDYTFFCAIVPHMRSAWASQVRDILKPDGELITLMFPISDHDGGPPYKVSVADYEEVLHPMGFKAISIVDNDLAIGPRKCKEFWQDSSSLIGVQMTCLELIQGAKTSSSGEYSGDRRDRFLRGFTYNIGRTSKHCGTTFWEKMGTANLVLEWPSEDLTEYDPAPAL